MELDRDVIDRIAKYSRRYSDLQERFAGSHQQLKDLAEGHRNLKHLNMQVSDLKRSDEFHVDCFGVALAVRFRPELAPMGPRGRVTFYERGRLDRDADRQLESVTFSPQGEMHASILGEKDADAPTLDYWMAEMVLGVIERTLRHRAAEG